MSGLLLKENGDVCGITYILDAPSQSVRVCFLTHWPSSHNTLQLPDLWLKYTYVHQHHSAILLYVPCTERGLLTFSSPRVGVTLRSLTLAASAFTGTALWCETVTKHLVKINHTAVKQWCFPPRLCLSMCTLLSSYTCSHFPLEGLSRKDLECV